MQISIDKKQSYKGGEVHPVLRQLLSEKYFRPSDTKMTYRQIDLLENAGLLNGGAEGSWQKFDAKDLVYLQVISDLKAFGFLNKQLEGINQAFYNEGHFADMEDGTPILNVVDFALYQVFNGIPWGLIIKQNGDIQAIECGDYAYSREKGSCWIFIDLHEVMITIGKRITESRGNSGKNAPIGILLESLLRDKKFSDLGKEFLSILQKGKYDHITIQKREGDEILIEGKKTRATHAKNTFEALGAIERADFQKIEVVTRNQKPVYFTYTDMYKGKYLKSLQELTEVENS